MVDKLNSKYWNLRYKNQDTGWNIGKASSPIIEYINQLEDKTIKILIPGCGYAYEAEYLYNNGFKNVFILDFSEIALQQFKKRVPNFPKSHLIQDDFFKHKQQYDLIIEQTFFCALHPSLREKYVQHCHNLLKPKGNLVGLLFNDKLNDNEPPFGGSKKEYIQLFSNYFKINIIKNCYNSIKPREGRELFINFEKDV